MLLRVFAVTDTSELGLACLDWCRFLLALDEPMRIAAAAGAAEIMGDSQGRSANPWSELRDLFATPLEDEYVNIVMTPPASWDKLWAKRAKRNVAMIVLPNALEELSKARCRDFDITVCACDELVMLPEHRGSFLWMKPLAASLEHFRRVVLP